MKLIVFAAECTLKYTRDSESRWQNTKDSSAREKQSKLSFPGNYPKKLFQVEVEENIDSTVGSNMDSYFGKGNQRKIVIDKTSPFQYKQSFCNMSSTLLFFLSIDFPQCRELRQEH